MPIPGVIAIDGPGASGKNTVGLILAQRLGYRFLDSGAMYRALTWQALQMAIDFADEALLERLAASMRIEVTAADLAHPHGGLLLDGADVTPQLHRPEVDAKVSLVAQISGVRRILVAQQRSIAAEDGIVVVGRDIGTVVLPEAGLKLYLDAGAPARARRRHAELLAGGDLIAYEEVLAALEQRDAIDSQRIGSPLRPAPDARIIATDQLTAAEVADLVLQPCQN
ncbi:MAG: (d)CMP kinase [Dehalococcoidia bacterium]|nr:(d)CMP kinase [Dehalococcoidia bacterium]